MTNGGSILLLHIDPPSKLFCELSTNWQQKISFQTIHQLHEFVLRDGRITVIVDDLLQLF